MSKNGKILLGVGGVLLLVVIVCGVVGKFAMDYTEKNLAEGVKADIDAGTEFGKTTDQKGCLTEALKRSKAISFTSFGEGMSLSTFAEHCMRAAGPTAGFCDGTPGFWSLKKSEWINAECHRAGMDEKKTGCFYVFTAKHSFCSPAF